MCIRNRPGGVWDALDRLGRNDAVQVGFDVAVRAFLEVVRATLKRNGVEMAGRNYYAKTPEFEAALEAARKRNESQKFYRLNPELQDDWPIVCFYPMSKKRSGNDNWYMLEFGARKALMGSHARTGRKYAGKISQLITGSTGLDDWEWGVTLLAHRLDDVKGIVYEMRFDEVTARYGDFGPFYVNLRLQPADLWQHLHL